MDADKIGLVLAKTSELRSKIINCIHETTSNVDKEKESEESKASPCTENHDDDDGDDGEKLEAGAESLLNIRDALESLEGQLSSLQFQGTGPKQHGTCVILPFTMFQNALQQQQWYEKEAALAEIEHSQKKLLKQLTAYKGKDFLEVINEAITFASETEESTDLLLPPYPCRPLHSVVSDNGYLSSTRKFLQNGMRTSGIQNLQESEKNLINSGSRGPFKRVKALIGAAAKSALTIVGVITILSLAGFEPRFKKRDNKFKFMDLFQLKLSSEKESTVECPPGKVPVIENGEMRCVVKERIKVPFQSVVDTPNVSYGCG